MRLFAVCLVVAAILWPDPATSSAPADFEADCIDDPENPVPPGHRRIFDTYSYEELFDRRNPILAVVNRDGGSGWIAGSGGSCREQLRICDYRRPIQPQNNWVFTQFINYLEATEVFVNVTYQYISCVNNARRGCSTLYTTAYVYEPEDSRTNNGRTDPANYESNHPEVLGIDDGEGRGEKLFTFKPSSNANGFYLGIQDTGTCGSIERVTVYYRIIPSRTDGLIYYPEIPLPPVESTDTITRTAVCAPHSTGFNLTLTADSRGVVEGDPSCLCDPGYQFESLAGGGAECTACRPGQYKPSLSNDISCLACPPNSASADPATAVCSCDVTFFRPPSEPDEPCTRPPSSPRLAITSPPIINGLDIKVCWLPSKDRGGRDDFHYNIYRLAAGSGQFLKINTEDILPNAVDLILEDLSLPVCYTLTGLKEQTSFTIVVVASNGAANDESSFTDVSDVENRFIAFYVATGSSEPPTSGIIIPDPVGPPGQITEVDNINGVAVWKPPEFTGGDLIGYVIRLYYYDRETLVVAVQGNITDPDIKWWFPERMPEEGPLYCQVRAINGFGPGEWSEEVPVVVNEPCAVNERCEVENGGCEHICANTATSVQCSCNAGYELDSDEKRCKDIDECATNNGGCQQRCTNIPGSRVCSCDPGFFPAGTTCQDIDECATNNGGCEDSCTNTPGSFKCDCQPGFTLSTDGMTCKDINECDTNNGGCEQKCTNIPGSHVCSCDPGFYPTGTACQDINECNVNNGGCGDLICRNLPGSFACGCPPGLTVAKDGITCTDLAVNISVDYDPPADFTPGPNEYRAASGPVTVTCTATGTGTGAVSYQWSSSCKNCPFQTAATNSVKRAAVHSGDTGTHTCCATQGGITVCASIDFNVVDCGIHLFRGSLRGNLPNNGLAIFDDPASGLRFRMFCRSDSMTPNVGQVIGLAGIPVTSSSFFAISRPQPGEIRCENTVGSQNALTASQQGVYTCRIPLQSGEIKEHNVGVYPNGFNTPPTITEITSARFRSSTILTCISTGSPATEVTWMRDGVPLIIDGSTYQLTQTVANRVESTYENVLTITPQSQARGTFTCTVTNFLGSDSMDISI